MGLSENLVTKKQLVNLFIFFLGYIYYGNAQCENISQVQPTIMVIPYSKSNTDILHKIENDKNYRDVITLIKDAFIQRDFNTEDFITEYQNLLKDNVMSLDNLTQDDAAKQIINTSQANIIVKAELEFGEGTYGNYIGIQLTAEDASSSKNLSNLPNALSPEVRTTKYSELAKKALQADGNIDKFINDMNKSFSLIKEIGQSVSVRIEVSDNANITLDEEMGEDYDYFSDLIIDWVKSKAYKNNYHIQGNTETLLYFDDIKIPLRDAQCNNYNTSSFEKEMRNAMNRILKKNNSLGTNKLVRSITNNKIYYIIESR